MPKGKKHDAPPDKSGIKNNSSLKSAPQAKIVLLVDDDPGVRRTVREMLTAMSFHVLEAGHAQEALRIAERHETPIHLLLTDVVMPGMSGRNIADELLQSRPAMKVLYMSGYNREILLEQGVSPGRTLLQKPFTRMELESRVREALESKSDEL
jgi:two-component system cell cycle sensor histidine kinase/response regulator CckA